MSVRDEAGRADSSPNTDIDLEEVEEVWDNSVDWGLDEEVNSLNASFSIHHHLYNHFSEELQLG